VERGPGGPASGSVRRSQEGGSGLSLGVDRVPTSGVVVERPQPVQIADDGRPVYLVERFRDAKFVNRQKHFLVEWQGFPEESEFTWEPRTSLVQDVPQLVREYEREARARARDDTRLR
jgi:Chromo (CHRromatin Organisation MOdifier) domain